MGKKDYTDKRVYRRHLRAWKLAVFSAGKWLKRSFNYTYETPDFSRVDGPAIITANHTNPFDPLFVGTAAGRHMYYVTSEHVVRQPFLGWFLMRYFEPIPRRKGSLDITMIKDCLRHIKAGHSLCLFAEGEQSWDGVTGRIFPATGKLVRDSKAALITYRIEGGFLTLPRWGKGIRYGNVKARVVGIYSPEELGKMDPDKIDRIIERDLYFDIWEWQRSLPGGPAEYKAGRGCHTAEGLERLLFTCPRCHGIDCMTGKDDKISCSCGFSMRFTDTGFLVPDASSSAGSDSACFSTIAEWDKWQQAELRAGLDSILADGSADRELFRDGDVVLSVIGRDHSEEVLDTGVLSLDIRSGSAVMSAGGHVFPLSNIRYMALMLSDLILFSYEKRYYQIKVKDTNIRKYLLVWEYLNDHGA